MEHRRPSSLVLAAIAVVLSACDAEAPTDPDAGLPLRAFGERCLTSGDCESGLCLVVGRDRAVCTRLCGEDLECPAGGSWGCIQPERFPSQVCGCAATATAEICGDGLDNDCNGRADDCRICGGVAVPDEDPRHCGACGVACRADQECSAGACRCPAGLTECAGRCVDLDLDESSCGACGNVCPSTATCRDGECDCPSSSPDLCGATCTDVFDDPRHCGRCGVACPSGLACIDGACECASGTIHCGAAGCVDVSSDEAHCGRCDSECAAAQQCVGGACACPASVPTLCADRCVDTRTDSAHCGACGNACRAGERCDAGVCVCDGRVCGGTCVDRYDSNHCGACGVVCGADEQCDGSSCVCAYPPDRCGDECVSLFSDRANCGACGNACPAAQECQYGDCVCPNSGTTYCPIQGVCAALRTDAANCGTCGNACGSSRTCRGGTCVCPTTGQTYCAGTDTCVNTQSDSANCGACGNVCPSGTTCSGGTCQCPSYDHRYCESESRCVDVRTDEANCGTCGNACPSGTSCNYGSCRCDDATLSLCAGTCVDTRTDERNCGRCGTRCGAGRTCTGGECWCPSPLAGTPQRITVTAAPSTTPRIAVNETHVAVVWIEASTETTGPQARFTLLDVDGTREMTEDLVLAAPARNRSIRAVDVTWNGTSWGVVWTETAAGVSGYRMRFQRVGVDGVALAPAITIPTPTVSPEGTVAIAHSRTLGHVVVYGARSGSASAVLQAIGADGSEPVLPVMLPAVTSHWPQVVDAVVLPDDRIGVLISNRDQTAIQLVDPDGAVVAPLVRPATESSIPQLLWDGATWIAPVTRNGSIPRSTVRGSIARGDALSSLFAVGSELSWSYPPAPSVAVRGAGAVIVLPVHPSESTPASLEIQRAGIPARTTDPLTPHTPLAPLGDVTTVARGSLTTAFTGDEQLVAVWSDTRWGQTELYSMVIDVPECD